MPNLSQDAVNQWVAGQKPSVRYFLDAAAQLEEWAVAEDIGVQRNLIQLGEALDEFISQNIRYVSALGREEILNRIRVLMAYIGPHRRLMLLDWAIKVDAEFGTSLSQVLLSMPPVTSHVIPVLAGIASIEPELAAQHNRAFIRYMDTMQMIPAVFGPDRVHLIMKAVGRFIASEGATNA